jgi:hypothetical protein
MRMAANAQAAFAGWHSNAAYDPALPPGAPRQSFYNRLAAARASLFGRYSEIISRIQLVLICM